MIVGFKSHIKREELLRHLFSIKVFFSFHQRRYVITIYERLLIGGDAGARSDETRWAVVTTWTVTVTTADAASGIGHFHAGTRSN